MGVLIQILSGIKVLIKNQKIAYKYIKMSPDELKALDDGDLDEAVHTVLYFNEDSENISKYNFVQLTAITIKSFDSEVNNGGLLQFFSNSSSAYAPYVIDSLNAIGATEISERFKTLIEENNIDTNDLSRFECQSIDEFIEMEKMCLFDDFDSFYYQYGDINEMLIKYIRSNIDVLFEFN